MQTSTSSNCFHAGTQPKVVCVSEDYFVIEIRGFEFFEANTFDGAGGAHRHEDRGLNHTATCGEQAGPRFPTLRDDIKSDRRLDHCLCGHCTKSDWTTWTFDIGHLSFFHFAFFFRVSS